MDYCFRCKLDLEVASEFSYGVDPFAYKVMDAAGKINANDEEIIEGRTGQRLVEYRIKNIESSNRGEGMVGYYYRQDK